MCEADLHARHLALLRWREERQLEHLMADPAWHDPIMAGWWAWGQSAWIGSGWCALRRDEPSEQIPHLSSGGMDPHAAAPSASALPKLPTAPVVRIGC